MKISVAMASYNGGPFIRQQIESILANVDQDAELVISDDGSTDETISCIQDFQKDDKRVKLIKGPQRGIIANFEQAVRRTQGELIFLSDQDDVWKSGKVSTIVRLFDQDPQLTCVLHDVAVVDRDLNVINPSFFELRHSHGGFWRNVLKNSFMGSAMAFKRGMLPYILPIPTDIPMHDQWIGLINERYGKVYIEREALGLYRRHGDNSSTLSHGTVSNMIKNRKNLLVELSRVNGRNRKKS
jgi:glycosyltransferase involved in cell wall biosynthesis